MANISAINNNFKNAKKLLEKAIEIDPKNLSAINNLATAHKELGELNESIKLYEKTLEISPNNPNACPTNVAKSNNTTNNYTDLIVKLNLI